MNTFARPSRSFLTGLLLTGLLLLAPLPGALAYLTVTYDQYGFFHLNSGQSDYVGYKPNTYNSSTPISLFVWMHGCGGDSEGDMWAICPPSTRQTQSYIAISIGGRDGGCWDVNADAPKVLAAITDIARYFNINPRKIYLGGYSSGGDLTYRVGIQNAALFAGLLVENSDPKKDSGVTNTMIANAAWKLNVAHLAHLSDTTYPIATVRTNVGYLTTNGFPTTLTEKAGTHYDDTSGAYGTTYDLITFLLPYLDAGWQAPAGAADISVEMPLGTPITDGGGKTIVAAPGTPASAVFTIKNPGGSNLTGLTFTKDGANSAEFTVTANPTAPVLPAGSTTFTVQFAPAASGTRTAALHLASNIAAKSPYDLNLTGQSLSYAADTDNDGLSDAAEFQWAALGFDWQVAQTGLIAAFNTKATAAGLFTAAQIQSLNVGVPLVQRNSATGKFKVTIDLQKATDLTGYTSFPLSSPSTATLNPSGAVEIEFATPDNTAFFRLNAH